MNEWQAIPGLECDVHPIGNRSAGRFEKKPIDGAGSLNLESRDIDPQFAQSIAFRIAQRLQFQVIGAPIGAGERCAIVEICADLNGADST